MLAQLKISSQAGDIQVDGHNLEITREDRMWCALTVYSFTAFTSAIYTQPVTDCQTV